MSRKCSGCQSFQKFKQMVGNSGLCLARDARTNEDSSCPLWKGIPFNRKALPSVGRVLARSEGPDDAG